MLRAFWSKTKARFREGMVPDPSQDLGRSLLDCPVKCCGNSEQADASARLGNLLLSYGHGPVSPIQQSPFDLRPVSLEVPLELADAHAVHTRGTLVLDHTPATASTYLCSSPYRVWLVGSRDTMPTDARDFGSPVSPIFR